MFAMVSPVSYPIVEIEMVGVSEIIGFVERMK
jgi:hypothetical protein